MTFGKIELEKFEAGGKFPQKAASALTALEGIVGASYKPILLLGTQIVKGVNYIFLCEQTLITKEPERHIVTLAVNEFNGEYELVNNSIEVII